MDVKLKSLNKNIIFLDLLVLLGIQFCLFHPMDPKFAVKLVMINIIIFAGLYSCRAFEFQVIRFWQNAFINTIAGTVLGVLFALAPIFYLRITFSRSAFIIITLLYLLVLPLANHVLGKIYIKRLRARDYLVIGKEEHFGGLLKEVRQASFEKINTALYINPEPAVFDDIIFQAKRANAVLIADMNLKKRVGSSLQLAGQSGLEVVYLPEVVEGSLKRIPLEVIEHFRDYYEITFAKQDHNPVKRLYDITGSLALLALSFPFLLVFGLAVFIESGSPIIFRQERVGKNNKPFIIYKFRTLRASPARETNPNGEIENRVTKVGKVLRKLRLDEFPQLINVLKGQMSLIGPRPEMLYYHQMCMDQVPFYYFRNLTRPGITGWAQDNYKHTTTLEEYKRKTEYDLYYVKNKGLFLDLHITLRTLMTMVGMRGSR